MLIFHTFCTDAFLLCQAPLSKGTIIVTDAVGAGRGDIVLVATGSAANNTPQTAQAPVDATAVAIVDTVFSGGQVLYSTGE